MITHKSDCAIHNAPAMEPGACDCKFLANRCDEAMARAIWCDAMGGLGRVWDENPAPRHGSELHHQRELALASATAARCALMAELAAAGWQCVPKVATEYHRAPAVTREDVARVLAENQVSNAAILRVLVPAILALLRGAG